MAAGLGFKTFTTGEVLTAADTNGYLMQGVLVFASSAARAAAITSPQEGQYSYLKDTNSTEYYDGAAWIAAPIGDITGVTAGTGISGGGTSGTVTITNSMATEIAAKGDLIVGTGAATFDNLTVGANGTTLVADSSTATGLKWATPATAASGLTYITKQTAADVASLTFDSVFTSTYKNYLIVYDSVRSTYGPTVDLLFQFRYAGPTTNTQHTYGINGVTSNGTAINTGGANQSAAIISRNLGDSSYLIRGQMFVSQVGNSSQFGAANGQTMDSYGEEFINYGFFAGTSRTYTGFIITASTGNFNGTFTLYGLANS